MFPSSNAAPLVFLRDEQAYTHYSNTYNLLYVLLKFNILLEFHM